MTRTEFTPYSAAGKRYAANPTASVGERARIFAGTSALAPVGGALVDCGIGAVERGGSPDDVETALVECASGQAFGAALGKAPQLARAATPVAGEIAEVLTPKRVVARAPRPGMAGMADLSGKGEAPTVRPDVEPTTLKPTQPVGEMSKGRAARIAKSIRDRGYDPGEPILVGEADGELLIINGHHRAVAAAAVGRRVVVESVGPVTTAPASWSISGFARRIRSIIRP